MESSRRSSLASVRASPTGVVSKDVSLDSPSSAARSAPSSASWISPAAVAARRSSSRRRLSSGAFSLFL